MFSQSLGNSLCYPAASRMTEVSSLSWRGFWAAHSLKLAISIVIAGAFVWTLNRGGLPLVPPRDALARVNVVACVEYLALCAIWFVVRALRWRHLLSPIASVPL